MMKNSGDMNKEEYKNFLNKGGKMKVAAKRLWNISQDEEMRDHISSVEYAREEGTFCNQSNRRQRKHYK